MAPDTVVAMPVCPMNANAWLLIRLLASNTPAAVPFAPVSSVSAKVAADVCSESAPATALIVEVVSADRATAPVAVAARRRRVLLASAEVAQHDAGFDRRVERGGLGAAAE